MNGYQPKDLQFGKEARGKLVSGIEKIYNAVSSTLGPRGNTVLMESMSHTGGMTVTKDGVTVAKAVDLKDPTENLAVRVMRQAASGTANEAGDGTTTSIVLTRNIINYALKELDKDPSINPNILVRELKKLAAKLLDSIETKPVGKRNLKSIATISANNDAFIGGMISDVYKQVGLKGVVTAQKSKTSDTYFEVTKGIKLDKGMRSSYFRNEEGSDRCVMDNPAVLVSTVEISSIHQVQNILEDVVKKGQSLVIIAPCSQNFVQMMAANVQKGNLKAVIIDPPSFGYRQEEIMDDIAAATGATHFSQSTGDDLGMAVEMDLGKAVKVTADTSSAVIITDETNEDIKEDLSKRISEIEDAYKEATSPAEKKHLSDRIAALSGGIGVIYAGGETDMEQKELYDRIEDAILAVKSAQEEGVVQGGGYALYHGSSSLYSVQIDSPNPETRAAARILITACMAPAVKILENAGADSLIKSKGEYKIVKLSDEGAAPDPQKGYNAMTFELVDLMESKILDPFKVVRVALTNAVSVASTILTTNAVVTLARSYES